MAADKIIEILLGKLIDLLTTVFKDAYNSKKEQIKPHLETQLRYVGNWCKKVEMFELNQGKETLKFTIDLDLSIIPKKFGKQTSDKLINADSLLYSETNNLLLGDPGAGKTTTVKRLCKKIIENNSENKKKDIRFPIVIQLRKIKQGLSLFKIILDYFGLQYKEMKINENPDLFKYYIGKKTIEEACSLIIESLNAYLFIDGLDEIDSNFQKVIIEEISQLAYTLKKGTILLTSRSGEYCKNIEGFNVYELSALTETQIRSIAVKWLDDPTDFINKVNSNPFKDTLNRPLSLTHLLLIYKNQGYLPEQPSAVYKKLSDLYIQQWDYQRNINRKSKYTDFFPSQKQEFIAAIAFYLIYKLGNSHISFSEKKLIEVYNLIYNRFGLPKEEALNVIREIESHNGIIVILP